MEMFSDRSVDDFLLFFGSRKSSRSVAMRVSWGTWIFILFNQVFAPGVIRTAVFREYIMSMKLRLVSVDSGPAASAVAAVGEQESCSTANESVQETGDSNIRQESFGPEIESFSPLGYDSRPHCPPGDSA
jgi:hypothetical protein